MSSVKRKRNVVMIEMKLEIMDQLATGVGIYSLAVHWNIRIIIQSSEQINYPNHPDSISLDNYCSTVLIKSSVEQF